MEGEGGGGVLAVPVHLNGGRCGLENLQHRACKVFPRRGLAAWEFIMWVWGTRRLWYIRFFLWFDGSAAVWLCISVGNNTCAIEHVNLFVCTDICMYLAEYFDDCEGVGRFVSVAATACKQVCQDGWSHMTAFQSVKCRTLLWGPKRDPSPSRSLSRTLCPRPSAQPAIAARRGRRRRRGRPPASCTGLFLRPRTSYHMSSYVLISYENIGRRASGPLSWET